MTENLILAQMIELSVCFFFYTKSVHRYNHTKVTSDPNHVPQTIVTNKRFFLGSIKKEKNLYVVG